jgi:hypothetical protein
MESVKIILLCILAAITYGIVHDQITARICVEYFTIGHPPVFHTTSPTLLGLGWGVIATWWVGLFLGFPLALAARCGSRARLTAAQLAPSIAKLLVMMACAAFLAGLFGFVLESGGILRLPKPLSGMIPDGHQAGFLTDLWGHSASYIMGFTGGVVLIIRTWHGRPKAGMTQP